MAKTDNNKDPYLLSSVNNSLRILELLMVRDRLSLKEVAKELKLNPTSTFKLLYTLTSRGFLYKDEHARYQLGSKLAPLYQASETRTHIVEQSRPAILQLWSKTQKTIFLGALGPDEDLLVLYTKTEHNQDSIRARTGATMNLHGTGAGKIILAFMEPAMQESFIERHKFEKLTDRTITDKDDFRENLAETRKLRFGLGYEENRKDHCDLAVPIFDYTGACVASIALVTDRASMDEYMNYYLQQLRTAGSQISRKLGYNG